MSQSPQVRLIGPAESVPVFNCRVIVSPRDAAGQVTAQAAELEGLSAEGASEREALQKLVSLFKARLAELVAAQKEIPWIRPGLSAAPGQRELFIAVHL